MTDETPDSKLTGKQRAFVNAYLSNGFNATNAALTAGYSVDSAHVIGSDNLKKVKIREAIDTFFEENSMPAKEVTWRLTRFARGDIGDVYDETTGQVDWKKAKEKDMTYLIRKVDTRTTRTTVVNSKGEETDVEVIEDRIELHDPLKALQLLGKQHGLFVDKTEISVKGQIILKTGMNMDDL